ncbi:dephospho-CoA kinase [Aquibium oceanicum]|uniref:Dephospho-CoA kinase n=1 Tax=Aquibium oceanicum TaxID=1670800 RepID=A0A1L3SLK0_9HYPH|nr:dephospho-CoA kinase [Aquibium oceanicum]APH70278.1 dephospho-CoA kinase [Aquibium oceanicum]
MIILGLTGSIGMGKSTTAKMFADFGVPVNDADATVHELYRGVAVPLIGEAFPEAIRDGVVDRTRLAQSVLGNGEAMRKLEAIVHPLVREAEAEFVRLQESRGAPLIVLDIPLLFEAGGADRVDRIVVVTASPEVQRERVLKRPGMTEQKFEAIRAKQMPDAEKRARADFVIDTGQGMEPARQAVAAIIGELTGHRPA